MTRQRLAILVGALAVLAACGPADAASERAGGSGRASSDATGEVTVFAAASLSEAFTDIGHTVEATYPALTVTFNFAGSQQLATQIAEGAPADVFASADRSQMDRISDAGGIGDDPPVFARNRLEIVVETNNPRGIAALRDLAREDVTVVLAAEQVPAGRYARTMLDRVGVRLTPVSLETDVRAVLTKVALGEADAGIVYRSDVRAADDRVDGVPIADSHNVIATYPIAVLGSAPNPVGARLFADAVRSDAGRAALERHGFAAP